MDALEKVVELRDKLYKISDIVKTAIHALEHINATESDCVITVLGTIEPILAGAMEIADSMKRAE